MVEKAVEPAPRFKKQEEEAQPEKEAAAEKKDKSRIKTQSEYFLFEILIDSYILSI